MKALITKKRRLINFKFKTIFVFDLYHTNGNHLATSADKKTGSYTQKHECIETLRSSFPNFKIEDLTV